jgi:AAA domain
MGRAMTEGEIEASRDSSGQEAIGGGHQPAPCIGSVIPVTEPIPVYKAGGGKVYNLDTFADFVRERANQHLNSTLPRDDALSMIASVATFRQLHETYGDDAVCAVIERHFNQVVGPAGRDLLETNNEPIFPGVITADRLQVQKFEPVVFVVSPIIAEGVTLLAGKPKLGKSWLMLDIALGIASGRPVLGNMPVMEGEVLGLFLEDSPRRLYSRIGKLEPAGEVWPANLALTTQWARIDEGGLAELEAWCRQAKNPKAIIIDTLAKLRPATPSKKPQYDLDYEVLAGLHKIAHAFQVAVIVVHHTRKADADDVFDTVSGTLGLTGAADSILVLAKRSGKAVLHARGRDIADSETALKFDPDRCRWVALGDATDVFVSDERARILAALDSASEPMSPTELMLATGIKKRNAIDILLHKMVRDGQIGKAGHGKYVNSGKVGKKDPAGDQASDEANEIAASANLSNLSGKEDRGDAANERTTP